jgi:histidinol-phosphate aminotransferase
MIKIPDWITNLKPYIPGKPIGELAEEKGLSKIVKLASNENPLGPSPKAIQAVIDHLKNANRYVDSAAPELVAKIAVKFGKEPDQIICGHGVDSLLGYILSAFTYVNTRKLGRKLSQVPLKNYTFDLEALLSAISPDTRVIYLANPNNPTGTMFNKSQFEYFLDQVPDDLLIILDEAYTEYASADPDFPNGLDYCNGNMIVTRTLSKSYGLAGLRVGFAVGSKEIIRELYKVKLPFEPNYAAQIAAAAALDDDDFLKKTLEINKESLERMSAAFDELGIEYIKSHANFMLLLMPSENFAESFFEECLNRGLIVRHVRPFGIPNGIRVNSSTADETEFALKVIETVHARLLAKKPV